MSIDYQLIIVGGGPAGLTAGLYAARAKLNVILLEKGATGGQVLNTDWIDNYPGFPDGISGFDLADKITAQAQRFDLNIKYVPITGMDLKEDIKTVRLENGSSLNCNALILATGARPNHINIPGENEFAARGVSYCATCDAPFYRDRIVAVLGGGNTAIQEAGHLTKFANKVYVIHRRDELRATKILQEKAFANDKIEFIWDTIPIAITGDQSGVTGLKLENVKTKETSSLDVEGVFVLIGIQPNNDMIPLAQLETEHGFIVTNKEMHTSIPGVFAAGDLISKKFRQIANAVGEATTACLAAEHYLAHIQEE